MRRSSFSVLVFAVAFAFASASAQAATIITKPESKGDQAIFPYDARAGKRSIIAISNDGISNLRAQVRFHGTNFSQPFARIIAVAPGGSESLVSDDLVRQGLAAGVGIAFATALDVSNKPIASRVLSAKYVIADAVSQMGTGKDALARNAYVSATGALAPVGSVIDGTTVAFARFQLARVALPSFFNPLHINPAELTFFSFNDTAGGGVQAAPTTWEMYTSRNDGSPYGVTTINVNGINVFKIGDLIGSVGDNRLLGGSAAFTALPFGAQNRLIFYLEAFRTFGIAFPLQASDTSFAAQIEPIFARDCATSTFCHARNGSGMVNLETGMAYVAICGSGQNCAPVPSVGGGRTRPYIAPFDPDKSYILNRILGIGGSRMPPGCSTCITDHEKRLIRSWILEGAKKN